MKKLLNTLYVTSEDAHTNLEGENIVVVQNGKEIGRYPLHILQAIYLFTYAGPTSALIGKCAANGIDVVLLTPQGKFLARVTGRSHGNVLLRRQQYRYADDHVKSAEISRQLIFGKIYNSRQNILRFLRNHYLRIDSNKFEAASIYLRDILEQILESPDVEIIRGLEGTAAKLYFSTLDDMILREKESFFFHERNRRPPLDNVNAILSYVYTLCGNECAAALEAVGLDPYVGFLHRDRPGRESLAQDLLEELRPSMCDRFVVRLINEQYVTSEDFSVQENGAVLISHDGRRKILHAWKERSNEFIVHPYLKEHIEWGLVPYVQAMLLARFIRGDIDGYPPFLFR